MGDIENGAWPPFPPEPITFLAVRQNVGRIATTPATVTDKNFAHLNNSVLCNALPGLLPPRKIIYLKPLAYLSVYYGPCVNRCYSLSNETRRTAITSFEGTNIISKSK